MPLPQRWTGLRATQASLWWLPPTAPTSWTVLCCARVRARHGGGAARAAHVGGGGQEGGRAGCFWHACAAPRVPPLSLPPLPLLSPAFLQAGLTARCRWTRLTRRAAWTSSRCALCAAAAAAWPPCAFVLLWRLGRHAGLQAAPRRAACISPPLLSNQSLASPRLASRPQVHAKNKKFDSEIDLKEIALRTPGFSGAPAACVCGCGAERARAGAGPPQEPPCRCCRLSSLRTRSRPPCRPSAPSLCPRCRPVQPAERGGHPDRAPQQGGHHAEGD